MIKGCLCVQDLLRAARRIVERELDIIAADACEFTDRERALFDILKHINDALHLSREKEVRRGEKVEE